MERRTAARKAPPPKGWRPRVVVSDVDGTLTHRSRQLDTEAVGALRAAEAAGVPVMLATGNVLPIVYSLGYFIGTTGPIVAENGGLVYYKGTVERLFDVAPIEVAAQAVEGRLGLKRLFTDRWRVTEVAYPEEATTLADVKRALTEAGLQGTVMIERTGFAVHLMSPEASKFRGVSRALELMGVSPDDALAVGDSDNDRSMIEGCRVGVALGNASPVLKAAADLVTKEPMGAGIAQALARYGVTAKATGAARAARAGSKHEGRPRRRAAQRRKRSSPARPGSKRAAAGQRGHRR